LNQVFEESSIFHGLLIDRARQVMDKKYDLDPKWEGGFGQAAYAYYVSQTAQELVDTSGFMHYGIDDHVCNWVVFWLRRWWQVLGQEKQF